MHSFTSHRPTLAACGATLDVRRVTEADAGEYMCRTRWGGGEAASKDERLRLRVARPPQTESRLVSHSIAAGARFELAVNVTGGDPTPTFQWRKNGVDIALATSRTLVIGVANWQDAGTYTCLLSNVAGSVEWEEAAIGVAEEEGVRVLEVPV